MSQAHRVNAVLHALVGLCCWSSITRTLHNAVQMYPGVAYTLSFCLHCTHIPPHVYMCMCHRHPYTLPGQPTSWVNRTRSPKRFALQGYASYMCNDMLCVCVDEPSASCQRCTLAALTASRECMAKLAESSIVCVNNSDACSTFAKGKIQCLLSKNFNCPN